MNQTPNDMEELFNQALRNEIIEFPILSSEEVETSLAALHASVSGNSILRVKSHRRFLPGWIVAGIGAVAAFLIWHSSTTPSSGIGTSNIQTYTTKPGQRASITLGDGSTVMLAPSTTVRARGRNIELEGQAVFTASPNNSNPFIVNAGTATVRVLGTTFSVRHYAEDSDTRVAVAVGKVVTGDAILSAGDRASVKRNVASVVHGADIRPDFGWTSGTLVINARSLREAIPELERWFGIDIEADEHTLNRPIKGELEADNLTESLKLLAFALESGVVQNGNKVVFTSKDK